MASGADDIEKFETTDSMNKKSVKSPSAINALKKGMKIGKSSATAAPTVSATPSIGKLYYENFGRKRALVKYQSKNKVK